jgi:hypothetical protein
MTAPDIAALRAHASKAAALFPLDEASRTDDHFRCPMCDGEGEVSGTTLAASTVYCAGVQVFGIGDEHLALGEYLHAANPATVLALLDRIEALEKALREAETERDRRFPNEEHYSQLDDALDQRDAAEAKLAALERVAEAARDAADDAAQWANVASYPSNDAFNQIAEDLGQALSALTPPKAPGQQGDDHV